MAYICSCQDHGAFSRTYPRYSGHMTMGPKGDCHFDSLSQGLGLELAGSQV